MKNNFLLFLTLIFMVSCQNSGTESTTNNSGTEPTNTPQKEQANTNANQGQPTFDIESYKDSLGNPNSVVSILLNQRKVKIGSAMNCEAIPKSDYDKYKIPANAIAACGGWWAGSGDYYYITDQGSGSYAVMHGTADEQHAEGESYQYQNLMTLDFQVQKPSK